MPLMMRFRTQQIKNRGSVWRALERGVTMVELLLSLAVISVVSSAIAIGVAQYNDYANGKLIASGITPFAQAALDYARRNRVELTTPGSTVTGVATKLAPTVAELQSSALGPLLAAQYRPTVPFAVGAPSILLTLIPTGCSGTGCDIGIAVTYPAAVKKGVDPDYAAMRAAVKELGSTSGYSGADNTSVIRGDGGAWERPNPLGAVGAVFGTFVTYSSAGAAQYLTTSELRNPNFLGNMNVAGSLVVGGTITAGQSVGAGTTTLGCALAEITGAGSIGAVVARASDCVTRVVLNGSTGTIETRSATGSPTVVIGAGGGIVSYNSVGVSAAGITYTGVISSLYADNLRNNAGTAGISQTGTLYGLTAAIANTATFGGPVVIAATATAGAACATAGAFLASATGELLQCVGGQWANAGFKAVALNAACAATDDGLALDSTTRSRPLICRGGRYVSLNTALGAYAWVDAVTVQNGSVVAALSCPLGATPVIDVVPVQLQSTAAGVSTRFGATGTGPWTVVITGAPGNEGLAWRGCQYSAI